MGMIDMNDTKKNVEEYVDLSIDEIFEILKRRIEGLKEFEVIFKDNNSELLIYIDYDYKKNRHELNVAKFVNMMHAGGKHGFVNVPDEEIVGTGHLYTTETGNKITSIGASGKTIKVFRHFRTLFFTDVD